LVDVRIDAKELAVFAKRLRLAAPELEKDFLKAESAAGEIIASAAREKADFSTRIPASIKVRRRGSRVRVVAGGAQAPHAAPFENHGVPGTFRHPVFGNYDVWVSQAAQPFLTPAAEENFDKFESAVLGQVDLFARRL
jgi:hypothetical protein